MKVTEHKPLAVFDIELEHANRFDSIHPGINSDNTYYGSMETVQSIDLGMKGKRFRITVENLDAAEELEK